MNKMPFFRWRIMLCLLFVFSQTASAQVSFADRCVGEWTGTLDIFAQGVRREQVPVVFTVTKLNDSTWTWKTDYRSEKWPVIKDYLLRKQFGVSNRYFIDEGEGIQLAMDVIDQVGISVFRTGGMTFVSRNEVSEQFFLFELSVHKDQDPKSSVDVLSMPAISVQTMRLTKKSRF